MVKLTSSTFVTLNGYCAGPAGDPNWHKQDAEEHAYAVGGVKSGNISLFGRVT